MGIKPKDWAWAKLGIAKTSDKDAIHVAYAAKRAELDAQAIRISAFAELTEAREKALFLASELQREAERSGETSVGNTPSQIEELATEEDPTVDVPEPPQEAPAEPEPEPEPEPEEGEDWELGGRFQSAANHLEDLIASEKQADEWKQVEESDIDPNPDQEWTHAGGYVPDAEQGADPSELVSAPSALEEASELDRRVRRAVREFLERYPIKNYWVIYGVLLVFLLRSCS